MDDYEGRSPDPESLHKYLYTRADPVNRRDPSGHFDGVIGLSEATFVVGVLVTAIAYVAIKTVTDRIDYSALNVWAAQLQSYPVIVEMAKGDKSPEEYEIHKQELEDYIFSIGGLVADHNNAGGPKDRKPIREKIEQVIKSIKRHIKEMRQKWPDKDIPDPPKMPKLPD